MARSRSYWLYASPQPTIPESVSTRTNTKFLRQPAWTGRHSSLETFMVLPYWLDCRVFSGNELVEYRSGIVGDSACQRACSGDIEASRFRRHRASTCTG